MRCAVETTGRNMADRGHEEDVREASTCSDLPEMTVKLLKLTVPCLMFVFVLSISNLQLNFFLALG